MQTDGARILVVEDEESLADSVRYNLEREGFAVSVATDGRRALERFRTDPPSLVILDLMLPEVSGLDVCRTIRTESDVPIIMVTAKDSEADKVTGLELGADDYVTKPFSMRELVSRVRANLRRTRPQAAPSPGKTALLDEIAEGRNDLEGPAIELEPAIANVLAVLHKLPGCRLARMSGSGATCFGLFESSGKAAAAGRTLRVGYPGWWVRATVLGGSQS